MQKDLVASQGRTCSSAEATALPNLSPMARKIYEAATRSAVADVWPADGSEWIGGVYLDDIKPAGITGKQFSGYLGSLGAKGLYAPDSENGTFGRFRLIPSKGA